ncbi:hypothetical protein [Aquimarina aquimarini]|uniref:hypothetical protein n=1 Tax=Aquimarina aquimarini TaxID=1191734 RepID=UPI000D561F11|nr:hypothetical protein [Aquimarina aquimarini]
MKTKNIYWIITGILNLFTALLHLIAGQMDLINPLFLSNLSLQIQAELLGVWHMVTIILFASSWMYFKYGFDTKSNNNLETVSFISYLYIAFSFAFIFSSFYQSVFALQWVLLLPIGILGLVGIKKSKSNN